MGSPMSWSWLSFVAIGRYNVSPFAYSGNQGPSNELDALWPVPSNCFIRNLRATCEQLPTGTITIDLIVRVNRGDTSMKVRFTASGSRQQTFLGPPMVLSAGDLLSMQLVCAGAGGSGQNYRASAEFIPIRQLYLR